MITLYSTPTCAPCKQIKSWLEERGLAYEMGDVDKMFLVTGHMSVPTVVWGEIIINGFRPQLMQKLYEGTKPQKAESI